MGRDSNGQFYVVDVCRMQATPLKVQTAIKNLAIQDGHQCKIGLEQDPGQAGVSEIDLLIRMLAGYSVMPIKSLKIKLLEHRQLVHKQRLEISKS